MTRAPGPAIDRRLRPGLDWGVDLRVAALLPLVIVLIGLGLPGTARSAAHGNAVQSLSIDQVDAIIRRPGHHLVATLASWCHPCIEELPALNTLARKFRPEGLQTLGLSVDYGGAQAMQPVVDRLAISFPVYWVGEAGLDRYAVKRIPLLIFVRDGHIVKRLEGRRRPAEIESEIRSFLDTP